MYIHINTSFDGKMKSSYQNGQTSLFMYKLCIGFRVSFITINGSHLQILGDKNSGQKASGHQTIFALFSLQEHFIRT